MSVHIFENVYWKLSRFIHLTDLNHYGIYTKLEENKREQAKIKGITALLAFVRVRSASILLLICSKQNNIRINTTQKLNEQNNIRIKANWTKVQRAEQ